MKLVGEYLIEEMAGTYVLFPVGQNVVDFKNIITINETGRFIFEQLQSGREYDEILSAMQIKYGAESDADVELLRSDLDDFLSELTGQRIIER